MNLMHQINLMQAQGTPPAPAGEEAVHLCWLLHKEKLKLSGLEINPDKYVDLQRKWRVPNNVKKWQSLAEFASSLIHPSYKEMKQKIDRKSDHLLWGGSPLPNKLIEYAAKDAYVTYEAWKKIEITKEGLQLWQEAEENWDEPYYWGY